MNSKCYDLICVGGGAAGFFGAINFAELYQIKFNEQATVGILEAGQQILKKVRISGGGRCNITNQQEDPKELIKNYPRGQKSLTNAFFAFGSKQMKDWLSQHKLEFKTEPDGRVFPKSNSSQTVVDLFQRLQSQLNIDLMLGQRCERLSQLENGHWNLKTSLGEIEAKNILMATGSSKSGYAIIEDLDLEMTELAPSLFTFKTDLESFKKIPGLSVSNVELTLQVAQKKFVQNGPILLTHWGFSGPAIIKLSAYAARELANTKYQANLFINWLPHFKADQIYLQLKSFQKDSRKLIANCRFESLPKRLWHQILSHLEIPDKPVSELKDKTLRALSENLIRFQVAVTGKGEFKEEFVTCGGLSLKELEPKSFEARQYPGLYFAGEVIDVDGITGGFNFQNAWTGSYLAAVDIIGKINS